MTLADENAELKRVLFACETWRRAYADAKGRAYSRGGEWAEFAMNYMPCNEGPPERSVRKVLGEEMARGLLLKELEWRDKNDARQSCEK